jgi:hypothetical protein
MICFYARKRTESPMHGRSSLTELPWVSRDHFVTWPLESQIGPLTDRQQGSQALVCDPLFRICVLDAKLSAT